MSQLNFDTVGLLLHPTDNVAVLKQSAQTGDELVKGALRIPLAQNIGSGHKIALEEIAEGAPVRKYGHVIGFARTRIGPGEHVHTHNLGFNPRKADYDFCAGGEGRNQLRHRTGAISFPVMPAPMVASGRAIISR